MKYCPECGKPLANETANFCDNCGAKLLADPTITVQPPEGSKAGSARSFAPQLSQKFAASFARGLPHSGQYFILSV